jgi:dehydrogenase/reductase SDR family protein 7B
MITGASSGLGESLAHSCYKAGCHVILAARRQEELERVKSDLLAMQVVRDNSHRL